MNAQVFNPGIRASPVCESLLLVLWKSCDPRIPLALHGTTSDHADDRSPAIELGDR
jgi:hypothetical protein